VITSGLDPVNEVFVPSCPVWKFGFVWETFEAITNVAAFGSKLGCAVEAVVASGFVEGAMPNVEDVFRGVPSDVPIVVVVSDFVEIGVSPRVNEVAGTLVVTAEVSNEVANVLDWTLGESSGAVVEAERRNEIKQRVIN